MKSQILKKERKYQNSDKKFKMKKSIIVLGGNSLHHGFEDIKKKLNINEIIVIDWNENPAYQGDRFIQCDIKDFEKIKKMDIDWNCVQFVYTSADIAVKTQILLHRMLGLLSPDDNAVENAMIKGRSTECWRSAGILNKYSEVVSCIDDIREELPIKIIVKPNCSSGSRNITILDSGDMSRENVEKAINNAKIISFDNKAIVEEFCEGTEFTVEMLGDNYGNVAVFGISKKYHTPYNTTNKIAVKLHYNPQDIPNVEIENISQFAQQCYKAVGLKNSFGHLEVIVTSEGKIVPVEIGARSSGYIATHLVDLINSKCFLEEYSKVIRNECVQDGIVFDRDKSSMYYFYDIKPGISVAETNLTRYLPNGIVSYAYNRSNLIPNKQFLRLNADHERVGFEILGGKRDCLTISAICKAEELFEKAFLGEINAKIL